MEDFELDYAICTLRKVKFFNDMTYFNINQKELLASLQAKFNISSEESIELLYSKAIRYDYSNVKTIESFLQYVVG